MPPRKDASATQQPAGIDAFDLPKALVTRLAKSALPPEAKLQKETVTALVRGATVFINYLAATAQEIATTRSRRTIASADVLAALEVLELGELVPLLQRELDGYRGEKESKGSTGGETRGKGKEAARVKEQKRTPDDESAEYGEDDPPEDNEDEVVAEAPNDEDADDEALPVEGEDEVLQEDTPSDVDMPQAEQEDEEVEETEIQDVLALEAEELQRDARGLEIKEGDAHEDKA